MSAPSDPAIPIHVLGEELGISLSSLQRWGRSGHIPKTSVRGTTTLLAAMRGIIAAVRAEADDTTPYIVPAVDLPSGAVPFTDAEAITARLVDAFDAALADAVGTVEAEISALHREPVAFDAVKRCRAAEGMRTELYAARRRTAGLGRNAMALAEGWTE